MGYFGRHLEFVLRGVRSGVDLRRPVTLGRQRLLLSPEELATRMAVVLDDGLPLAVAARLLAESDGFIDALLRHLGAEQVESLDISEYEGSSILHDLNERVPSSLRNRFSVVLDGGTLEHVFDVPTALWNVMQLPEIGGHIVLIAPSNDEAGHGLYQFSPELFLRLLVAANGYHIEEMLLGSPCRPDDAWHAVTDPMELGWRSEFSSEDTTYVYVRARKVGEVPERLVAPCQHDYVAAWTGGATTPDAAGEMHPRTPPPYQSQPRAFPRLTPDRSTNRLLGRSEG